MSDDDEEAFGELYENGHWIWDETTEGLIYLSDLPPMSMELVHKPAKLITGAVEFKDDIDLIEQMRFRRRYQRKLKPGQADVITLQDVKDLAIYTAPLNFLSPMLIQMLHFSTTERFLRALILYCQYYLQTAEEMVSRILEAETKVRTPDCRVLEYEFRDNLSDLRLLVAKEYGTMLIGGAEIKKYHHKGPQKKRASLSDKDARFYETLFRISVQIVWLALERKSFNQIELEVNRLFKCEIFNSAEHNLRTGYMAKMAKEEKSVLLGQCLRRYRKLNSRSPIMNEVFCHRPIDYQMMGLGVIKYSELSPRLRYMQLAVSGPEEEIRKFEITVGILGFPRSCFDTMLRVLQTETAKSTGILSSQSSRSTTGKSTSSAKKSLAKIARNIYPEINLPVKKSFESIPQSFPDENMEIRLCSDKQRKRWLNRLAKLQHQK